MSLVMSKLACFLACLACVGCTSRWSTASEQAHHSRSWLSPSFPLSAVEQLQSSRRTEVVHAGNELARLLLAFKYPAVAGSPGCNPANNAGAMRCTSEPSPRRVPHALMRGGFWEDLKKGVEEKAKEVSKDIAKGISEALDEAASEVKESEPTAPSQAVETVELPKASTFDSFKEGVTQTLAIRDDVVGTGEEAKSGDVVTVKYAGRLLRSGVQFDAGELSFKLGVGEVISGWDQGLQGMQGGGKRTLRIPSGLAYGSRGAGEVIPPNAALEFDCELVGIARPKVVPPNQWKMPVEPQQTEAQQQVKVHMDPDGSFFTFKQAKDDCTIADLKNMLAEDDISGNTVVEDLSLVKFTKDFTSPPSPLSDAMTIKETGGAELLMLLPNELKMLVERVAGESDYSSGGILGLEGEGTTAATSSSFSGDDGLTQGPPGNVAELQEQKTEVTIYMDPDGSFRTFKQVEADSTIADLKKLLAEDDISGYTKAEDLTVVKFAKDFTSMPRPLGDAMTIDETGGAELLMLLPSDLKELSERVSGNSEDPAGPASGAELMEETQSETPQNPMEVTIFLDPDITFKTTKTLDSASTIADLKLSLAKDDISGGTNPEDLAFVEYTGAAVDLESPPRLLDDTMSIEEAGGTLVMLVYESEDEPEEVELTEEEMERMKAAADYRARKAARDILDRKAAKGQAAQAFARDEMAEVDDLEALKRESEEIDQAELFKQAMEQAQANIAEKSKDEAAAPAFTPPKAVPPPADAGAAVGSAKYQFMSAQYETTEADEDVDRASKKKAAADALARALAIEEKNLKFEQEEADIRESRAEQIANEAFQSGKVKLPSKTLLEKIIDTAKASPKNIFEASKEALRKQNEDRLANPLPKPENTIKKLFQKQKQGSLYKQLDEAIEKGDLAEASRIKAEIDKI